jgi:hypothetical protein
MRLDRATIALKPQTLAGCADLATRFIGAHLEPLSFLWFLVAGPALGAVYVLHRFDVLNFWTTLAVVYLASSPLGVLLGLAAIPTAFGEPMSGAALSRRILTRGPALILTGLMYRLAAAVAGVACVIPGIWVAVRTGFFVERACLGKLEGRNDSERVNELVQSDFSDLMSRSLLLCLYCGMLWISLFFTVDILLGMFGLPILFGRIVTDTGVGSFEYLSHLVWSDLSVMLTLAATGLAVYGLGRIAWFFCYVDLRVRRDLWDMELRLTREAKRLEGAGG